MFTPPPNITRRITRDLTRALVSVAFQRVRKVIAVVSVARHMGPGTDVFAGVMGLPNRQGHGAKVAGDLTKFARVTGPADRQGHGATRDVGGD